MNIEPNQVFDVLLTDGQPNGKLTKIGAAFPTQKGNGYRITLKESLPEGARLLILPSRSRESKPAQDEASA